MIYIGLGIFIYLYFYQETKDALNPFGVSLLLFDSLFGISCYQLSVYQDPMLFETHVCVIIVTIEIFLVGTIFCKGIRKIEYHKNIQVTTNYKFFMWTITLISAFATLVLIKRMRMSVFSLDIFSDGELNKQKATVSEELFGNAGGIGYLAMLFPYLPILIVYDLLFGKNTKKTVLVKLAVCLACAYYTLFILSSRGVLLAPVLGIIVLLNRKYHFHLKRVFILVSIMIIAFYAYMEIRVTSSSGVFGGTSINNRLFNSLYNYLALSFNNLNQLIQHGSPYSGISYSFITLSKVFGIYDESKLLQYETLFFNSRTFLYGFYHDLGILGVIIWPTVIFSALGWIYKRSYYKPEYILLIAIYAKSFSVLSFGNYFFNSFSGEIQYIMVILAVFIGYEIKPIRVVLFRKPKTILNTYSELK